MVEPNPSPSSPQNPNASAAAAAKGVLYSIILRFLSFSLSQITIRLIQDPRTLGYSSIQLELLCSTTVLFLSREGFRLSLVRFQSSSSSSSSSPKTTTTTATTTKTTDGGKENNHLDLENHESNQVNNVAWLSIPFGICLTIFALFFHLHQCSTTADASQSNATSSSNNSSIADQFDYKIAGIYFCIATIIEVISEPCMIHCLSTFNVAIRAKAEGAASIGKALTTVLLLSFLQNRGEEPYSIDTTYTNRNTLLMMRQMIGPVSSFGIAQIVYAIVLSTILYQQTKHELYVPNFHNIFTTKQQTQESTPSQKLLLHRPTLKLSITFTIQSMFKHLLTEGDRIILSTLVSSYNAGIYALVSSYGSIVSRMILLPLEENGRLLFSHYHGQVIAIKKQMDQQQSHMNNNGNDTKNESNKTTEQPLSLQLLSSVQQLETTYIALVKLVLYVGFFFIAFGSNYTATLLQILAGSKWGNNKQAYQTLSIYCSYILCMAWNGMTEAFVYGVVDDSVDVGLLSIVHGVVGFVFYVLAPWLVLRQDNVNGTIGLIIANQICMVLRSLYSMHFAAAYFQMKKETICDKQREQNEDRNANTDEKEMLSSSSSSALMKLMKSLFSVSKVVKRSSLFYHLLIQVLPPKPVLVCFAISFKFTQYSKIHFLEKSSAVALLSTATLMHIGVGVLLLLITFLTIYRYERKFGGTLKAMMGSKSKATEGTSKKTKTD